MSGGQRPRTTEIDPDSLQSLQIASLLYVICEGPSGGPVGDLARAVHIDGVPVQNPDGSFNFEGVQLDYRNGENVEPLMRSYAAPARRVSLNREVTKSGGPQTFRVNGPCTDVLTIIATNRLLQTDGVDGDQTPTSVEFLFELSRNGASFNPISPTGLSYRFVTDVVQTPGATKVTLQEPITLSLPPRAQIDINGSADKLVISDPVIAGSTELLVEPITFVLPANQQLNFFRPGDWFTTITGKTSVGYEREISFGVILNSEAEFADIRVTRVTDDAEDDFLSNRLFVNALNILTRAAQTYPNTAKLGLTLSGDRFDRLNRVGILHDGLQCSVPSNYNPITREHVGLWDGSYTPFKIFTDNPAYCLRELKLSRRFGSGRRLDTTAIDNAGFYTLGRYCDELVNGKPRFRLSAYLTQRRDAFGVYSDLASVFRGLIYYYGGTIAVRADRPRDPVRFFTAADVLVQFDDDGRLTAPPFSSSGTALSAVASVFPVRYAEPDDLYREATVVYRDPELVERYGPIYDNVAAFGCADRDQAYRVGQWRAANVKYRDRTLSFRVGPEGIFALPWELIAIANPATAITELGGRLKAIDANGCTLDRRIDASAGTSYLYLKTSDGGLQQVEIVPGSGDRFSFVTPLIDIPPQQSSWLWWNDQIKPEFYTIVAVTNDVENGQSVYTINAVKYDERAYTETEAPALVPFPETVFLSPTNARRGGFVGI